MKYYSVIGDSISTFENTTPDGYAIYYDKRTQQINNLRDAGDMWWSVVGRTTGAQLLVNGSWSGGTVVGEFPGACSRERTSVLGKDGVSPDYILIYIGINDCGIGARLRKDVPGEPDQTCFASAYRLMLSRLREAYPGTKIFCGTIMRSRLVGNDQWDLVQNLGRRDLADFNEEIRSAAKEYGCAVIDLFLTGKRYEALDGVHPTAKGHADIASAWIQTPEWKEFISRSGRSDN